MSLDVLTSFRGVLIHAKWVKCESTLHAITSVLIFLNSLIRSENAKISVGHTNVLCANKDKSEEIIFFTSNPF